MHLTIVNALATPRTFIDLRLAAGQTLTSRQLTARPVLHIPSGAGPVTVTTQNANREGSQI